MNSPKKMSPEDAGDANSISLKPISVFLYTVFRGYINIKRNSVIIPNSIRSDTTRKISEPTISKIVGIKISKIAGHKKNAHINSSVYKMIKKSNRCLRKRLVLSLISFLAIDLQRAILI
jgi:hypothetical protein